MNCDGFFIAADFLYWRAENHGFSYAFEFDTASPSVALSEGSIVRVNPEWDPAFRVGLGWNTTYDFWDLFLNYTWYRNNASKSSTSENGFASLWPAGSGLFGAVSAKTRFMLQMGDFEVGRLIYLTKSIAFRPHIGARGGILRQSFNSSFSSSLTQASDESFSGKNNYWGIGPRTGFNGEWHIDQGFSLIGHLAGALLYGKTDAKAVTQQLDAGSINPGTLRNYQDKFYQLVPHLQMAVGLQWQTCFWCEKMFFKMGILWETNYWWNQFNLPFGYRSEITPLPTVGNQPLTMEGLTVNFEWDF